jgi:modification methylase
VRPDGSLSFGEQTGSIHRMGAAAMGATACNGWTYWHIERDTGRVPIDLFRREIREGM